MEDKIIVKESKIHEAGAFAAVPIKAGELICVFGGENITIKELMRRCESGEEKEGYPLQIGDEEYLDLDEPYVYVNHSCSPNAGLRGKGELIALRDIPVGEEITYDYSTTQWDTNDEWGEDYEDHWTMGASCLCGSKKCRKIITEFNFLPENVKKDYLNEGILMNHILAKASRGS